MGSGSTAIASMNLKRKFIGIEKDQEIYEKSITKNRRTPETIRTTIIVYKNHYKRTNTLKNMIYF